ncbi:MAG: hypothetical protein ACI905_002540, partial [Roseivirga sp.]
MLMEISQDYRIEIIIDLVVPRIIWVVQRAS